MAVSMAHTQPEATEDDEYESDFESDDDEEIQEDLEVIYYEDEDEVHYGTGLPFWLLEAESALELASSPPAQSTVSSFTADEDSMNEHGWLLWLVEAEAVLGLLHAPVEAPTAGTAGEASAAKAPEKPKLARSGSFERRRKPCADASNTVTDKPKLIRSGSFERRRKTFATASNSGTSLALRHNRAASAATETDDSPSSPATICSPLASCHTAVGTVLAVTG